MMCECTKCKRGFLSESDPYMVVPTRMGTDLICHRCFDKENQQLRQLVKDAVEFVKWGIQDEHIEWTIKAKEILGE